ncbi:MAG: hypothetical protein H7Y27_16715 [Gemmatimonadaceae bacterium]|nr:hypothetical protein [Chitinophagaceae bacterium]
MQALMGKFFGSLILFLSLQSVVFAQKDSTKKESLDSFLLRQKGLVGKLARNFVARGEPIGANTPVRTELIFSRYEGYIIRRITIERLNFGTPITDTSRSLKTNLTRLADAFHYTSREYVIRNNLFFKSGDKLFPYLLADNERHLRDQAYLLDAKIIVRQVRGSSDSVDIEVRTKDVLSIGGGLRLRNTKRADVSFREDNLAGSGNRLLLTALYDKDRSNRFGTGGEFIQRNIAGSFIDAYVGYKTFFGALNSGRREEMLYYAQLLKPLVNPYMKWTYGMSAAYHKTENMYLEDSLYFSDARYRYFNYDAFVNWNTGAFKLTSENKDDGRLRTLLGIRFLKQQFQEVPEKFINNYFYMYADVTGVLASVNVFRQNFYKTSNIFGFGRTEDVPEGIDVSVTAGWIRKQAVNRPYVGLSFQKYYFTVSEAYYNLTFRAGSYYRKKKLEDADLLFNMDYFSRLMALGSRWKQRSFISTSIGGQFNKILNEPLFLESQYGLPELRNDRLINGDARATVKAESVFYSPFQILNFRFAPFMFGNITALTAPRDRLVDSKLYSSIGAGLRTRNESLVFSTVEMKAYYFPRPNFYNKSWRIEFNTNVRFKYNQQTIKKPEIVMVN